MNTCLLRNGSALFVAANLWAREAVYWLHWLHISIFPWSDLSFHMFHGVDKQFPAFFTSVTVFVIIVVIILVCIVVRDRDIGATFFVSRIVLSIFRLLFFAFWVNGTDFCIVMVFLKWWHVGLSLSALVFVACWLTVFICSSSRASKPFRSNCLSRCVTIFSCVAFSKRAWFIDFFGCGGILLYINFSMMACAATPNASMASF